ncbi:MAG: hypothetical protein NT027_03970, partial [Proteobacteria bacterium]|nr:hypothetical protein [Pseudomonadota bacterium]
LQDLRLDKKLPFFSDKQRNEYPEKFKQVFFKNRKDIRMFGAGGAFEKLIENENLPDKSESMIRNKPLSDSQLNELKSGTQGIRFFMAFAVMKDNTRYDFSYSEPSNVGYALKTYYHIRDIDIQVALWDSKDNKTVWSALKKVSPSNSRSLKVRRISVPEGVDMSSVTFDADDNPHEESNLTSELSRRPERFPSMPDKEPAFSESFDDFALALPLHPSEEKLIEYESFTYHRPELSFLLSKIGDHSVGGGEFGFSSRKYNKYRLGFAVGISGNTPKVAFENKYYNLSEVHGGLTTDFEFRLAGTTNLQIGALLGWAWLNATEHQDDADKKLKTNTTKDKSEESLSKLDATWAIWPRIRIIFNAANTAQFYLGGTYRKYYGIEENVFKENTPANWSADAGFMATFRGF